MDIIALAGSRHVTQDYGALRCVGSFNNAINFLTENARLLTLHRAGSGLSPMGWQLGARDFDRVRRAVPSVRRCAFRHRHHVGCVPGAARRRGAGSGVDARAAIADRPLTAVLQRCTAQCGLHGELGRLVRQPLTPEPAALARDFSRWLRATRSTGTRRWAGGADAEQRRHLARPAAERPPRQPHPGYRAGAVFRPDATAGRADHAGECALPALRRAGRIRHAAACVGAGDAGA